jgi:DHA1 family bicyclomycin/chloramphenicol resistance-like MFS transporter
MPPRDDGCPTGLPHEPGATDASAPARAVAAHHSVRVLAILSMLMAFGSISTDVYLPALPTMAGALKSDAGSMELTISGYLIGFSLGQLLWGPIADRFGRRGPVAFGLVLFVIGSAGCALSTSAEMMIGWRLVQAVGACAGVVLARAMVRDLYAGERAAQMLSTLLTVMAIAPLIGPFVGAQILSLASWRAIFWTLVGVGILTMAALLTLPETLPPERRYRQPLGRALLGYLGLLGNKRILGYAAAGAFYYGGLFAYVAGTPFAYIGYYHLDPQLYPVVFAAGIVLIMATNIINARLVMRVGSVRLMRIGTVGAALAGLAAAAAGWTGWGGLAGLAVPLTVFIGLAGLISANSIAGALASFPERAGAVSALVGTLHYGTGVIGSGLVGSFADGTPWPLAWVIATAGVGCAICAWFFVAKTRPL